MKKQPLIQSKSIISITKMNNDTTFIAQFTSKNVQTLLTEYENQMIDLTAPYQRDIIWKNPQQSAFINSVIRRIMPLPLVFNVKTSDKKQWVCMDGKQLITLLINFYNNKVSTQIDSDEYIYYSVIPTDTKKRNKKYRIFTQEERNRFNNTIIPMIVYENLTQSDERDIFQRIQFGSQMTDGELVLALFNDEIVAGEYKKLCKKYKKYFKRYIRQKTDRSEEYDLISYILTGINNKTIHVPTKLERDTYLLNMKLEDLVGIDETMNIICKKIFENILNDEENVLKLNRPILFPIIFLLDAKLKEYEESDDFYEICVEVVKDTNTKCAKRTISKTQKSAVKIQNIFNKSWKLHNSDE